MPADRPPNALPPVRAADIALIPRLTLAAAVIDDRDPAAVPVAAWMRLPYQRFSRWVFLDARKLPSRQRSAS